ncbi:MAG: response regulator [Cyanobacteria bacterium]|nr:response regulator [Cyanobacteriota bacterium]
MSDTSPLQILVVEDDDDDFLLALDALEEAGVSRKNIARSYNGQEMLDYLRRKLPSRNDEASDFPNLIFLDLNMPIKNGKEALVEISRDPDLKDIPIVMLTTSSNPDDIKFCSENGANLYIVKEGFLEAYNANIRTVISFWSNMAA